MRSSVRRPVWEELIRLGLGDLAERDMRPVGNDHKVHGVRIGAEDVAVAAQERTVAYLCRRGIIMDVVFDDWAATLRCGVSDIVAKVAESRQLRSPL